MSSVDTLINAAREIEKAGLTVSENSEIKANGQYWVFSKESLESGYPLKGFSGRVEGWKESRSLWWDPVCRNFLPF